MPRERSEWFGIVCIRTSMPPAACTPFADRQDMWTYPHERSEWLEGSMQELQELCSVATHAGLHDASLRECAESKRGSVMLCCAFGSTGSAQRCAISAPCMLLTVRGAGTRYAK